MGSHEARIEKVGGLGIDERTVYLYKIMRLMLLAFKSSFYK